MWDVTLFGSSTSKPVLPWWTITISSSFAHWPRTGLTLSVLIIPALWWADSVYSQSPENLPSQVADYRAYLKAVDYDGLNQFAYVISELQPVWSSTPASPLAGHAAMLAARAHMELGQPAEAASVLR